MTRTMDAHYYNVGTTWVNGRKGLLFSPEISTEQFAGACIEVATPPQFPKGVPGIWSPEHLLTAAVSSCFMTTFLAVAENSKLDFTAFKCNAVGKLELLDGAWIMTEVALSPSVTIVNEQQRERAGKVLQKTENGCLISNSIRAKVSMVAHIEVTERLSTVAVL